MNYNFIKNLIESNKDVCEFASFGDGISDLLIQKTEERLAIKLPPSYIWWLKNYSGGEINGEEVYSIYESDLEKKPIPSGGIVYINELNKKNIFSSKNQLIIHVNNQAETYYFNLQKIDQNGEYPVYVSVGIPFLGTKYADNFLEFLLKKIQE